MCASPLSARRNLPQVAVSHFEGYGDLEPKPECGGRRAEGLEADAPRIEELGDESFPALRVTTVGNAQAHRDPRHSDQP